MKCQKKYDKATKRFEKRSQKDLKSKNARVRAFESLQDAAARSSEVPLVDLVGQLLDPSWRPGLAPLSVGLGVRLVAQNLVRLADMLYMTM
jgi:hypothetical protein